MEDVYSGKTCQFVVVKIETHNQPLILATAYRTVLLMKHLVFVKNCLMVWWRRGLA